MAANNLLSQYNGVWESVAPRLYTLPTNRQHRLHQGGFGTYFRALQINWLTAGLTVIWVQLHTDFFQMPPRLLARLFPPFGNRSRWVCYICSQLLGTGYEYSEPLILHTQSPSRSEKILVSRDIFWKMPRGNRLAVSSLRREIAHIAKTHLASPPRDPCPVCE